MASKSSFRTLCIVVWVVASRTLAQNVSSSGTGNIATCYDPVHSSAYPLNGAAADIDQLRQSIDDDFRLLSKYVTHIRTFGAQFFGISVAPIAAKYNLKLYLGVTLTSASWYSIERDAAVSAVKDFPGTVEAVLVGNENMIGHAVSADDIIAKVNEIKSLIGSSSSGVKFGTSQRITEYVDEAFNADTTKLADHLDIMGVNIYPFFDNNYNPNEPTKLLNTLWSLMVNKFPATKVRLTETGFPTGGSAPSFATNNVPSLEASINYYNAVKNWVPTGAETTPKFWFMAFDRRAEENVLDYERSFGFFTTERASKAKGFPTELGQSGGAGAGAGAAAAVPVQPQSGKAAGVKLAFGSSSSTSSCSFESGVDYVGNDLTSAYSADVNGCCAICKNVAGCSAFSWTSYNGGTCWLKSSKGATTSDAGANSGYVA